MEFLRNNKRFSFKYEQVNAWDLPYRVETQENGNELTTTYFFESGIKICNVAKKYEKYGAYEWVNYIENTTDKTTGIISELWDCDCPFAMEHEEKRKWQAYFPDKKTSTKIFAPSGSNWTHKEFYCDVDALYEDHRLYHIYPGYKKSYAPIGGRSSDGQAPFFNVHKNGKGYIFAVGWSGQWNAEIERKHDEIIFRSKIEDTYFRLYPGEKFRTSSVVVMPYVGDVNASQNKWRRLVKEHFSLVGKEGRITQPPLNAMIWGGMRNAEVLNRIRKIEENKLPYDFIWMDAGWYGGETKPTPDAFEGDWATRTGDWRVSSHVHPNGLKDVSAAVHKAGLKYLLWVEIERSMPTTPMALAHPEYFLTTTTKPNRGLMLNLGNASAWQYAYDTVNGLIDDLQLDCYRCDYNVLDSLSYWRKNDAVDRSGISEIKYINGLYRLWDTLLEKHPHLMIDNCASGGRRIDIELLRRSLPFTRSDFQGPKNCDVEANQCHHYAYNQWIPYSGTFVFDRSEYAVRSAYDSMLDLKFSQYENESFCETEEDVCLIRQRIEEYLKVRAYFSEDFYPLTELTDRLDAWLAVQFDRPSQKDGIVQVFCREKSVYETANFKLQAIREESNYKFTDLDGGEFTVSGKDLLENGFRVTITERPKAKIYIYKEV